GSLAEFHRATPLPSDSPGSGRILRQRRSRYQLVSGQRASCRSNAICSRLRCLAILGENRQRCGCGSGKEPGSSFVGKGFHQWLRLRSSGQGPGPQSCPAKSRVLADIEQGNRQEAKDRAALMLAFATLVVFLAVFRSLPPPRMIRELPFPHSLADRNELLQQGCPS